MCRCCGLTHLLHQGKQPPASCTFCFSFIIVLTLKSSPCMNYRKKCEAVLRCRSQALDSHVDESKNILAGRVSKTWIASSEKLCSGWCIVGKQSRTFQSCLLLCCHTSSFDGTWYKFVNPGDQILGFRLWNVVPNLLLSGFWLFRSSGSPLLYVLLHDAPNILKSGLQAD